MADINSFANPTYFNEDVTFYKNLYPNEIVMTSPNGTKYKLVVSNDGTLSTEPVS
jgi:hypothetical protein